MKLKSLLIIVALVFISCKNDKASDSVESSIDYSESELDVTTSMYPESISKVFKTHGGIDEWNQMQTIKFSMSKSSGDEVTITDLQDRHSRIDMPNHVIGYDGQDVWLRNKGEAKYEGNPKFYYNLMFYFYAMPFVLADDGIIYEEVKPLSFEGKSYPGIKISYESGVGESPEDEYILYYDSETNKMAWLAYTVTYFSKKKEKDFHFIRYSSWQNVNNFVLPKTITWYNYENNLPTTKRNDVEFSQIILTEQKMKPSVYSKPEEAEVVE